jgi:protein-L-isoaspartate(D-aspartate) O-methyltransferase
VEPAPPEPVTGSAEPPPAQPEAPAAATTPESSPADTASGTAVTAADVTPAEPGWTAPDFLAEEGKWDRRRREDMVTFLRDKYRHRITDERILQAMGRVPRQEYMLPEDRDKAYNQMWYRIGFGQTITDPGMVAWMIQLLDVKPTDRVLEIGTGSGYHSSVIVQITPHTYSIEIVGGLAKRTDALLQRLGYGDVIHRKVGDGYFGWEEEAPFDKIIVTCAADHIPVPLLQQLRPGGLMVIPIGPRYQPGKLYFVAKGQDGAIHKKVLTTVEFVPMTRKVR